MLQRIFNLDVSEETHINDLLNMLEELGGDTSIVATNIFQCDLIKVGLDGLIDTILYELLLEIFYQWKDNIMYFITEQIKNDEMLDIVENIYCDIYINSIDSQLYLVYNGKTLSNSNEIVIADMQQSYDLLVKYFNELE